MGSHPLNELHPFPVEWYSRDVKASHNGQGALQFHGLFDFHDGLGDVGGSLCASEIHQKDFSVVVDDEMNGCNLKKLGC